MEGALALLQGEATSPDFVGPPTVCRRPSSQRAYALTRRWGHARALDHDHHVPIVCPARPLG